MEKMEEEGEGEIRAVRWGNGRASVSPAWQVRMSLAMPGDTW
jgi:hypothetical protein